MTTYIRDLTIVPATRRYDSLHAVCVAAGVRYTTLHEYRRRARRGDNPILGLQAWQQLAAASETIALPAHHPFAGLLIATDAETLQTMDCCDAPAWRTGVAPRPSRLLDYLTAVAWRDGIGVVVEAAGVWGGR